MNKKLTATEKKKIKRIIKYICMIFVLVILCLNVSFSFNLFGSYGCISVAFDKWDMMHVNKAYIVDGDNTYEITDRDLIKQISKETRVATKTDVRCQPVRWIELYYNEKLVRRIGWTGCCDGGKVYTADASHWIWPSCEKEGFCDFSRELLEQMSLIIDTKETP